MRAHHDSVVVPPPEVGGEQRVVRGHGGEVGGQRVGGGEVLDTDQSEVTTVVT